MKVYVERNAGKIESVLSPKNGKLRGLTEVLNDSDPEVQAFLNPPVVESTSDAFLDDMYDVPFVRAIVKKISDVEGKSETQVRNELKVLAKQK